MKINESYKPLLKNWLYGIAFYFFPFIIGYFAFSFVLSDNVLHTDVDSARYMLSALVQGEAAIVALVVTLSLVAVQLAAQSYSARVIEVFRRTPDLWILMGIYGVAIFYGLGVLKMIEKANPQVNSLSNLEGHIAFSYYLGVFAYVALVPYIWKTLDLLKPSTVINMLAKGITKENILYSLEKRQDSPIQPIIDIVRGSLDKYDYETVREGLKTIGERTNIIFANEIQTRDEEEKISKHIFPHLTRMGKLAASKNDEDSTLEVIYNVHKNGITAIEHRLQSATLQIELSLEEIGKVAAEYKLEDATRRVVISLGNIGKVSAEYKLENAASWAAEFLGLVGIAAAVRKLGGATQQAAVSLGWIGIASVENKLEAVALKVTQQFENIGIAVAEQELEDATQHVAESLSGIGIAAANQKLEVITKLVASLLGRVGIVAAKQELEAAYQVVSALEKVGIAATEQEFDDVSKQVAFSLGAIGITTAEQKPLVTWQVVKSLEVIGMAAAKRNFKSAIKNAVLYLELVLKTAKEHKLEGIYQEAEESLKKLNEAINKLERK